MSCRPDESVYCVRRLSATTLVGVLLAFSSFASASAATHKASDRSRDSGPMKPIGHSLSGVEERSRIEKLLAQRAKENLQPDATAVPAGTNAQQYGFPEPPKWSDGLPRAFVSLGSVSPAYGIVVEKLHHRLTVFRLNEEKKYDVVKTYRAITGKDPGDKVSTGDLRTPEGIYFITGRMDQKRLPAKYGRMAFTLDYPNIYDRRKRKSGYGIWIHATDDPKRLLKPFDTEGCVALSNEDVVDLAKYIVPFETPVVITKEMTTTSEAAVEQSRSRALGMIDSWRRSWELSDFSSYMSHYSKNFVTLGKNKVDWLKYKESLASERSSSIRVRISEPKILAFEDQLLAVFMQEYNSKTHNDFGRKFVYLQWEGDRYRIIAEKWYKAKKNETAFRTQKQM